MKKNEPTTDWGDDWVEPDVRKRFGVPRKKSGTWIVVLVLIAVALLAYLAFRSLT